MNGCEWMAEERMDFKFEVECEAVGEALARLGGAVVSHRAFC